MSKVKLLTKICAVVTTSLFGFMMCATIIAGENTEAVSNKLNTPTFEIIPAENADEQDTEYYKSAYSSISDLVKAGKEAAAKVEAEGVVLLKNENSALPLNVSGGEKKISLVGISSVDPAYGGKGSAQTGNPQPPVTPSEGFTNAGFSVNPDLLSFYSANTSTYKRGTEKIGDAPWSAVTSAVGIDNLTTYGDAAIYIMTRVGPGEGSDMTRTKTTDVPDGDYLKLSTDEISVLKGLKELKSQGKIKKIVVLINSATQIESEFLYDDNYDIDAALWIGSVGITGFNSVANIVAGAINPSGHLSDIYWFHHDDNPVMANLSASKYTNYSNYDLPFSGRDTDPKYNSYLVYQEGIYIGYRYAETRYYDVVTGRENAGNFDYSKVISHPFGYGDSYTEFSFSDYNVAYNGSDHTYTVSLTVQNIGNTYSGKEVVQVYLQKPFGQVDIDRGIEKSAVELVGYAKTSDLAPQATERISVTVNERDFAVYDANEAKTYIITAGDYYLTAATNSHSAVNNILAAQNYTTSDGMDDAGDKDLVGKISMSYDDTTWSTSVSTGNDITNLFDDVDINKYFESSVNSVTYMSRTDWAHTVPTSTYSMKMSSGLVSDLLAQDNPSNIDTDDTDYPTYGKDSGLQLIDMRVNSDGEPIDYNDEVWDTFMDQLSWEDTTTLLYTGLRQTALLDSIGKPKTVDHNGPQGLTEKYGVNPYGLATRTNDPDKDLTPPYYPCAGILAATFNDDIANLFGDMLGEDAIWAGYGGFYGIGLNTHRSPYGGRSYEYYSEDPFLAGKIAAAEVRGLQSHGCNAYIKHFALNDQESQRNGVSIWANEQTLREIYLRSYEICVQEGGARNAMASFTRVGALYAPACGALLTGYLRGELGMTGFVVTDMYSISYDSAHMPTFLMAGCDIPDGEISKDDPYETFRTNHGEFAWQMREAAKRILYVTVQSNAMNGVASGSKIVKITPSWMVAVIVVDVVLGVLFAASVVGAVTVVVLERKKENKNK